MAIENSEIIYGNLFINRPFPKDLEVIVKVHNFIKGTKNPTKKIISEKLKLKLSTVSTSINYLRRGKYIETTKKYSPPYLKVTDRLGKVIDWIYGKDKRLLKSSEEKARVYKVIKENNLFNDFRIEIEILEKTELTSSQFIKRYNSIVIQLLKKGKFEIYTLDIGIPAYKFKSIT